MARKLYVVNKNNEIIFEEDATLVHEQGLLHRSVHVILINKKGEFFCRKINQKSPFYKGYWSTATGAHLEVGMTIKETAQKSLQKLLGIQHLDLDYIGNIYVKDEVEHEISATFISFAEGPFTINKDFLEDGQFFSWNDLQELQNRGSITPHLIRSIELYLKK